LDLAFPVPLDRTFKVSAAKIYKVPALCEKGDGKIAFLDGNLYV
jgi:hypothetical protein